MAIFRIHQLVILATNKRIIASSTVDFLLPYLRFLCPLYYGKYVFSRSRWKGPLRSESKTNEN